MASETARNLLVSEASFEHLTRVTVLAGTITQMFVTVLLLYKSEQSVKISFHCIRQACGPRLNHFSSV